MTGAFGIQDALVALLALAALGWLVRRRLVRRARPTPFCGDCPGCAPAAPPGGPPPARAAAPAGSFVPLSEFGGRRPR